jgi:hypothetical protein
MISKILLTLGIIVALVIFMRVKGQERVPHNHAPTKPVSEGEKMFRQGAWLFLVFMVISAIVFMYFGWNERHSLVNVHIINTRTGETTTYQAEQQDVKSDRFKTLQGRTVYLADIERMEIEPQ